MNRDNVYILKLVRDRSISGNQVLLDELLFIKHGFPKNFQAELLLGSLTIKATVSPGAADGVMIVSSGILEQLNLPDSLKISISITGYKIRLGPILGLFANENTLERLNGKTLSSRLNRYCGYEGILLFYFFYTEVDLEKLRINGFIYNFTERRWEKRLLPLPDVIYNRGLASFPVNQRVKIEFLMSIFKKLGVKKINSREYFDKWETYCKFKEVPEMKPFLPETVLYNNLKDLEYMTSKYRTVFAKGCRGNNGREVVKIVNNNGVYAYSIYTFDRLVQGRVEEAVELAKRLLNIMGKKRFILQQGIKVINVDGNTADIRALLQKDTNNSWQITNLALRVAAKHVPVTSTITGSHVYRLEKGLQMCGLDEALINKVKNNCRDFLELFGKTLESEFGPFGETGVDLAVDESGKLWFIECNANPAKTVALLSGSREEKHLSLLYPLQYAKYLAGF